VFPPRGAARTLPHVGARFLLPALMVTARLRENPLREYEQFLIPTAKAAKRKRAPAPRKATPRTRSMVASSWV
jgi:hypothetical protein